MLTSVKSRARAFRKWLLQEAKSEIRSAQELQWLTKNISVPIPSTIVSLQSSTINWIINDIIINQRTRILELGAGTSTQIIAQCLSQIAEEGLDRQLVSIEENQDWTRHVNSVITKDGNKQYATVHHVPRAEGPGGFWYDEQILESLINDYRPDVLIIDGPAIKRVARNADRSRVFHFFRDRMADNYVIFIDDTIRKAERQLTKDWAAYCGTKPFFYNAYLGFIKKGDGFNSKPN